MLIKILLILLGFSIFWVFVVVRILKKFFRFPAPAFVGHFLDSDFRRRLQPPDKLIQQSGIKEEMKVLDLGCGSGAYTTFVAMVVGEKGRVYALDIEPKMLRQLKKKLAKPGNQDIKNIEIINKSAYEIPLNDDSLDLVYIVSVLQEIPDRQRALKEIKRVLKPKGILAVTELLLDPDYALKSTTIGACKKAGFILDEASGNLWNYTVRFKKS